MYLLKKTERMLSYHASVTHFLQLILFVPYALQLQEVTGALIASQFYHGTICTDTISF